MSINRFISNYLNFTTREKAGIFGLLFLIALFYFLPTLLYVEKDYSKELKEFEQKMLEMASDTFQTFDSEYEPEKEKFDKILKPFYFNPNTVEPNRLVEFGVPKYVIIRFEKFRNTGFVFRKKEDLKKIYGLTPEIYKNIEPYIVLEKDKIQSNTISKTIEKTEPYVKKPVIIELNSADSLQLLKIKGIGPFLCSKILRYRNALGGFISTEQLNEIFGIKPEQIEIFKPFIYVNPQIIKRLNVNTADYFELNKHPYISSKEANAIIQYRKQHGLYLSIEDLKKVYIIKLEQILKLEKYLAF